MARHEDAPSRKRRDEPEPHVMDIVPRTAVDLLERSWVELVGAQASLEPSERFVRAHLAALRAGAAVIAARGRPRLRGRQSLNVWNGLDAVAPELRDWVALFAASAARRAAVESGRQLPVSAAEADEHLARATRFAAVVGELLRLPDRSSRLLLTAV